MENLIEVLKKFLPLIHVPPIIQNKIEILNLTALKTQIPINYLTLRKKKKKKKNWCQYFYMYLVTTFTAIQIYKEAIQAIIKAFDV
jgi:radical SAM superfamily enzyme